MSSTLLGLGRRLPLARFLRFCCRPLITSITSINDLVPVNQTAQLRLDFLYRRHPCGVAKRLVYPRHKIIIISHRLLNFQAWTHTFSYFSGSSVNTYNLNLQNSLFPHRARRRPRKYAWYVFSILPSLLIAQISRIILSMELFCILSRVRLSRPFTPHL